MSTPLDAGGPFRFNALTIQRFSECSRARHMHLDFADLLNLVSTVTLIGALVFTGMQVRAAKRPRSAQIRHVSWNCSVKSRTARRRQRLKTWTRKLSARFSSLGSESK